jgi:hypothetical protein
MNKPHNQSGQVSILDRVAMQAGVARTVADRLPRGVMTMLYHHATGTAGFEGAIFDWKDAARYHEALEALTQPGEAVEIVALKASLRAWAQLGADRAKAVAQ